MITHHPELDLLFDYASGSLSEPMALSIACHASTCKQCRDHIQKLEEVGGALMETVPHSELGSSALNDILARLDEPEPVPETAPEVDFDSDTLKIIPKPLRSYLQNNIKDLNWRTFGSKVAQLDLDISVGNYKASLMKFKAGSQMPVHEHKGNEITLVLSGSYTDEGRCFERGDFDAKDSSDIHQPYINEGEDCIALVVMDAPVVLAGSLSRFLNPFVKIY